MQAPSEATPVAGTLLQRKCACGQHTIAGSKCSSCAQKGGNLLQRSAINNERNHERNTDVPAIVHEVLRSPGQPLDKETRAFMEPRLGGDFSRVRVHTEGRAAESARAVSAFAYTVGSNVVFEAGKYEPGTSSGRMLLAHELAHVKQQDQLASRNITISSRTQERFELEAQAAAQGVQEGKVKPLEKTAGPATPQTDVRELPIQRFGAEEHRSLGNQAFGTGTVNVGGTTPGTELELQFGDVVALSADFFLPDELSRLAAIPGNRGTAVNTRDEIIYALHSMRASDPRFSSGGVWAGYTFTPAVAKAVNDRYQTLAAANTAHFVAPRGRNAAGQPVAVSPSEGSAGASYRSLHESALRMAYASGRSQLSVSQAMAREAAAQHFLSDSFSAGHLRTPIGTIRDYWTTMYPLFWYNLRHKIALDTAIQINAQDNNVTTAIATVQMIYERIIQRVEAMVHHLPQVTLGDLLAKIFHDFDNAMGLSVGGGQLVFGDAHLDDPNPHNVTRSIAVDAMRAGIRDVNEAFSIGQAGTQLQDAALYDAVRNATGAPAGVYVAETRVPQPDPNSPQQNWRASNFENLWIQPIVGTSGPTVGSQIAAALQPSHEIRQQLDDMAEQFPEVERSFWGDVHPRRGYLQGFVRPLANNPRAGILNTINWAPNYGLRSVDRDDISLVTGQELAQQGRLGGMTTTARVSYIRELIDGWVTSEEEQLVVRIFETAPTAERRRIYQLVERHAWTGDWIHGVFTRDDDIWDALSRARLAHVRVLINAR